MAVYQRTLEIRSGPAGLHDITERVAVVVRQSQIDAGLCTVFIPHTSASLIIQENADPAVRRDLEAWMRDAVPETRHWEHCDEGPDDMPAHVRAVLTHTSESIPFQAGRLLLGTWQAIYLWEHRRYPQLRRVVVHVQG